MRWFSTIVHSLYPSPVQDFVHVGETTPADITLPPPPVKRLGPVELGDKHGGRLSAQLRNGLQIRPMLKIRPGLSAF